MKHYAVKIALLALVAVGMLSISSCEKEKEDKITTKNSNGFLSGVWNCTDDRYAQTGTLQLHFKDGTVMGINSTGQESIFDSLNSPYGYSGDYLYINGVKEDSITVFSENEIKISFLGGILACGECPSGEYNFRREGGAK